MDKYGGKQEPKEAEGNEADEYQSWKHLCDSQDHSPVRIFGHYKFHRADSVGSLKGGRHPK